jgi:hypothetical protein
VAERSAESHAESHADRTGAHVAGVWTVTERLPLLLLAGPAAAFVLSAVLLVVALRGRRVDDHPICRKCGFDLFGKPEGATVCSECGADLTRQGAVRIGRREKRRRLIGVALPVLIVCTAWLGLLGWGASRGTDWNKHKPVWWLMRDARGPDAAARDAALRELARRLTDGKLTPQRVDALVDLALDVQGDRSRPWADGWGEVVGAARDAGKLSPEKWRRYARQGVEVKLETRPTLRRGDVLVFMLNPAGPRLAPGHSFGLEYERGPMRVGDWPLEERGYGSVHHLIRGRSSYGFSKRITVPDRAALAALADGSQTLRLTVRLRIADRPARTPGNLVDELVEVTAPFTLLPAGAETVRLRNDPELKAAVEAAFSVEGLLVEFNAIPPSVEGRVMATQPPVATAFRVRARSGDNEWDLGAVNFSPGHTSSYFIGRPLRDLHGLNGTREVDIVLKPSIEEAVSTMDLTEIWGGEVVLKDVPVRTRPPVTRPAPIPSLPPPTVGGSP